MTTWLDVWHMALGIVARQPPFTQILFATGAVLVAVMALEGLRTSLAAIGRAHLQAPPPQAATPPALAGSAPPAKSFSGRAQASASRRPKPLTLSPRQFRSPRPTIRRHATLAFAAANEAPEHPAPAALALPDAL